MNNRVHIYLVTVLLTIGSLTLLGQNNLSDFSISEWKSEIVDLPGLGFEEIVQDSSGFLWIGTGDGLIRYDGYRTKTFVHEPDNPNSLSSGKISDLYLQNERYLWVGCYESGGLNRMDLLTGSVTHYLDSMTIREIISDAKGNIWVGSPPAGLYRLDPTTDSITHFRSCMEDSVSFIILTIMEDKDGIIWAGGKTTNDDPTICRYFPDTETYEPYDLNFDHNVSGNVIVTALMEDSHGNFWLGTSLGTLGKLYRMNRKTSTWESIDLNPGSDHVGAISTFYEDFDRQIWILTWSGLFLIDPLTDQKTYFGTDSPERTIPSDVGWTICQSQDSVFWIGTGSEGSILYRLFETTPQLTRTALKGLSTYSFLDNDLSPSPDVWISTDDGLVLFDLLTGIKKHYAQDFFLPDIKERIIIHSLCQGLDSMLWAACLSISDSKYNGILGFDPQKEITRFYPLAANHPNIPFNRGGPSYPAIHDLEFDGSGMLIVATLGSGLQFFDPKTERFLDYERNLGRDNGLQANIIVDLFKNQKGEILVTGRDFELPSSRLDYVGPTFFARINTDYRSFTQIPLPGYYKNSNELLSGEEIFQDDSGNTWIQNRIGFLQLDTQFNLVKIVKFTNSNLLPVPITKVIMDEDQFWIKGENSIYRFDPILGNVTSNIIGFANPANLGRFSLRRFSLSKALRIKDGTILFSADSGFMRLNPRLSNKSNPSKIRFESIKILQNKARSSNISELPLINHEEVILKHDENNFSVNFFTPDFREPENNTYKFTLEHYDEIWNQTTSYPEAIYRRVPPGDYHFRVQAKGYRQAETLESSLHITILPPWFWAWWSKSLYLLLFISSIHWIYQYQLKRQLAIAEANRLKELDTFKSMLYTNITHEFRTPLTIILGLADQLQDKVIEAGKEGLQMIGRNGNRLLNLVNQMLDLQKLEAGAMPIHLIQGDIVQYLKYLVESFHSYAESKNIDLQFIANPESLSMDYDPQKIQDIVSNLMSNAFKFTPKGGAVIIECSSEKDDQFKLIMRDNGVGISQEKLPHIFERFYQADDSSIPITGGTGVGLALTKELVQLLGGDIAVNSILGAGSEFMVMLPIRQAAPISVSPILEKQSIQFFSVEIPTALLGDQEVGNSLAQVLIIEDNHDVVQYLSSILKDNYQITTAVDGQEGVETALEFIPDLIISDVMMPRMDGYQVCSILKQDLKTSHIPIILLTAKADMDSKLEGLQYGADAYLTKPFNKQELLLRITAMLDQRLRLQAHFQRLYGIEDANTSGETSISLSKPENLFVNQVQSSIREHLDDSTFGVDQLCQKMTISNSQLYRKLKAHTGLSAHDLIQSIRLSHAKSLLKETSDNISEIAYQCGFNDPEYFSRVFKKAFGRSPSDCRIK